MATLRGIVTQVAQFGRLWRNLSAMERHQLEGHVLCQSSASGVTVAHSTHSTHGNHVALAREEHFLRSIDKRYGRTAGVSLMFWTC
jgi:hypothetical protein